MNFLENLTPWKVRGGVWQQVHTLIPGMVECVE